MKLTHRGPGHASAETGHVLVDLGPYLALAVPGCGGLARRNLGDVDSHGPGVRDGGLGVVVERLAGRDVVDAGCGGAWAALVASDGVRVDVGDGPVALEVGRGPDILPVGRVGNAGEGVLCLLVSVFDGSLGNGGAYSAPRRAPMRAE